MMLAERIEELKGIIAGNDGSNAADPRFARAVDDLVSAVFDDIGQLKQLPTRALFELFVIKVLYVGRRSRHADIIDYLGELLDTHLYTQHLYPPDAAGRPEQLYVSDVIDAGRRDERFATRFDAYRRYADNALFVSGIFAAGARPRRSNNGGRGVMRTPRPSGVDAAYYVTTGKAMYRLAAREDEAARAHKRDTLARLGDCFEIYVDALNEMSRRYIMGFDMDLIATKMLDAYNRYRTSGDAAALRDARRYAAIVRVDPVRFPALFDGGP